MPNNPYLSVRILEFYFVMHWSVLVMVGSLVPFKFFHEGTQTFVVVCWWTLKLTHLLGFRLVLFNDPFFCTTFLGSLTPYSRHFFIRIVGASAPKRRPQPSFLWVWSCWTMDPLHSHKAHVGTSLHQPQFAHVVSCDWWKSGGGGSMWGHPSTNHMDELWHLLYHFMWH